MKRWVCLGLLGGMMACTKVPDPGVEVQVCPGTEDAALPHGGEAPAPESVPRDELLVVFRPSVSASAVASTNAFASEVERVGARVKRRIPHLSMVAVSATASERAALASNPDVVSIQPNRKVHAMGLPRLQPMNWVGGLVNRAGAVGEYTEGLQLVQAPQVWDANNDGALDDGAPTGEGIKLCVIDSGWDNRHPELKAAYKAGRDFIDDDDEPLDQGRDQRGSTVWGGGHGTHVAGTIAAQLGSGAKVEPGNEPNGVVGVAPGVELYVARVLDVTGSGSTADVISALKWCQDQGARIASLSLGSPQPVDIEREAFAKAKAAGVLAIAASGNEGNEDPALSSPIAYPAAYDSVLAVGAVNFNSEWASFSQYGPELSLVGPGVNVLSSTIVGGAPFSDVLAQSNHYASEPLEYSGIGTYTGKLVNCGLGASIDDCGDLATCEGFVAYVDRGGGIYFEDKARNAIQAGARAVIVGNNVDDGSGSFTLTTPSSLWVPTTAVSLASAGILKGMFGQEVTVDVSGLDYLRESGTSMATPHVAGVAALVWSARPDLTNDQVRQALEGGAKDLGDPGKDPKYGNGLVQAPAAIQWANAHFPKP